MKRKILEGLFLVSFVIGQPLYFLVFPILGLREPKEKYMLIRPSDVVMYMYVCATVTLITFLTAIFAIIYTPSLLWALAVTAASFFLSYQSLFFVSHKILDYLLRKDIEERGCPALEKGEKE
jgi:hypothetical protein